PVFGIGEVASTSVGGGSSVGNVSKRSQLFQGFSGKRGRRSKGAQRGPCVTPLEVEELAMESEAIRRAPLVKVLRFGPIPYGIIKLAARSLHVAVARTGNRAERAPAEGMAGIIGRRINGTITYCGLADTDRSEDTPSEWTSR